MVGRILPLTGFTTLQGYAFSGASVQYPTISSQFLQVKPLTKNLPTLINSFHNFSKTAFETDSFIQNNMRGFEQSEVEFIVECLYGLPVSYKSFVSARRASLSSMVPLYLCINTANVVVVCCCGLVRCVIIQSSARCAPSLPPLVMLISL